MTFATMQTIVFRRLRESSTQPVYFTLAQIQQAINDGYAELSDATEWRERHTTIDVLNDRPYYDARANLGESFLSFGAAFNETTNRWLEPGSVTDFADRRWETTTGSPQRLLTRGLWWLSYWPREQSDAGTIKQYWVSLPDDLTNDGDEPGFPEPYHIGCVHFAVADLQAQDGQSQQALLSWQAYLASETALRLWVDARARAPLRQGYVAYAQ